MTANKVYCSINRKWFVDEHGNPADRGTTVHSWCEDESHEKPIALLDAQQEAEHDQVFHPKGR